jgi:phosphatidylglycerol:prolipoprotein diacylglycerol transferase
VHKIAFELGGLAIYWYGVLVATGFLAGLWTANQRSSRSRLPEELIPDLSPWLIGGAIIGARALYVISYWREYFAAKPIWEIFMVRHGGLVFYGGLVGAALTTIAYARWRRLGVWKIADVLAPSIALGHAFGRVGCLMNGCCYGRPTNLPWAIRFPANHDTGGAPVHPTEIYEALLNLLLYVALAWAYRRKRFDGQIFAAYLVAYAILRAFVEMFRGDYTVYYVHGWFTPGQLVSFGMFAAGLVLFWKLPRQIAEPQPAPGGVRRGAHRQ